MRFSVLHRGCRLLRDLCAGPAAILGCFVLLSIPPLCLSQSPDPYSIYVRIPGTQVSIVPPKGYVPSDILSGVDDPASDARIVVTEMGYSLNEALAAVPELAPMGVDVDTVEVRSREKVTVSGSEGYLLEVAFRHWRELILLLGNDRSSVMVSGGAPSKEWASKEAAIRLSVLSSIWQPELYVSGTEGISFSLEPSGRLALGARLRNTLIYTKDGVVLDSAERFPRLTAAAFSGEGEGAVWNSEVHARKTAVGIEGFTLRKFRSVRPVSIDSLPGYEVIAAGRSRSYDDSVLAFMVMLYEADRGYIIFGFTSPDGDDIAAYRKTAGTFRRFVGTPERREGGGREIISTPLVRLNMESVVGWNTSGDFRRYALVCRFGQSEFVLADGRRGKAYEDVMGDAALIGREGGPVVYLAKQGDSVFAVVDTVEGARFAAMTVPEPTPDGGHWVSVARRDSTLSILRDGAVTASFPLEAADSLVFGGNAGRLGYRFLEGSRTYVRIDSTRHGPYLQADPPSFSPDGSRAGWEWMDADSAWWVNVDSTSYGPYDDTIFDVAFTSDGSRFAFSAQREGRQFVVTGEGEGKAYDEVGQPFFSTDGERLVYTGVVDSSFSIVVEGKESAWQPGASPTLFRGFSTLRPLWATEGAGGITIVDGNRRHGPYPALRHPGIVTSPGGKHFACVVGGDERSTVVLDGRESGTHSSVLDVRFSPRDERMVYLAFDGPGTARTVVDGEEGPSFDFVVPAGTTTFRVDPDGTVRYMAVKNEVLYMVEEREGR